MEEIQTDVSVSSPIIQEVNPGSQNVSPGSYPRMASFSDRFVSWIIDSLLLMVAGIIVTLVLSPMYLIGMISSMGSDSSLGATAYNGSMSLLSYAISIGIFFGYYGYFYTTKGQTLGKMAMKIKVVKSTDLQYLGWGEVFIRELIRTIASDVVFFLGYLWYFMSEKRQTWHDMVSSAYVVKTDDSGNILMDGQSVYPKEPIKTFGCCSLFGIIMLAITGLFIYGIVLLGQSISEGVKTTPTGTMRYDSDTDVDIQNDYNLDVNDETQQFDTEEDMRQYLEENFPEELEQLDQVNDQGDSPESL